MPLLTNLASLSQTPASNAADGSVDAPSTLDNQINLLASFIAQIRDNAGGYTSGRLLNVRVISTVGATVYTPTTGTKSVLVEIIGGGASGAGCNATGASQVAVGSGGTAGAYAKGYFLTGFSGVTVTIGAGGAAISGQNWNNGGASSFGALMSAPGGSGASSAGPTSAPIFTGATISTAPTGGNVVSGAGAAGAVSIAISTGTGFGGAGGNSQFGAGGSAAGPNTNGVTGSGYGTGGGGCFAGPSQAALSGGAGTGGTAIIYEYA